MSEDHETERFFSENISQGHLHARLFGFGFGLSSCIAGVQLSATTVGHFLKNKCLGHWGRTPKRNKAQL
ncbi:hypothetical protein BKA56DRAFT_670505 [Ilyonectria sp. MPI-CAGE-AT-0026]|nr:hypothetical protein BKA56DRAFT_670505 [Ilyonectria sp. MPI-CAGE-AT-0026]